MSSYTNHDKRKGLGRKFQRDLSIKTDREKPAVKGFWKRKFVEFCKRTDLHGYKYIVMEGLNKMERTCWALAVLVSTVFAAYFVVTAYKWYARNPIVTVIESTQGAIWDIPFPAVTICDLNIISKKAARNFADNMTLPANVTANFVFETVRFAPLLHSEYVTTAEQKEQLHVLQRVLDLNNVSLETLFRTLSPASSCNELMQRCMWKNTIYRCDQLFKHVFTMFQLCCTFNYYAIIPPEKMEITNFHHYEHVEAPKIRLNKEDRLHQFTNPRRVASCGYQTALTVLLKTDPADYYSAIVPSQGALVYIDSAYNLPNLDSPVRMVNPGTEVLIALSPERTYTTSGVRSFSPEQRQCYYSDEVKIGEFQHYSLHNCIAFYRMKVIKKICECVPFYFPVKDDSRVCNFNDLECLENTLQPSTDDNSKQDEEMFTCLPECEHYDYPIEVAMGTLATHVKLSGLPFFNNVDLVNRSLLNVFFNDLVSTRFRRDVYFNWQNFTAAFGGLLSLMLGFTLISGFDLLYFFTLKLAYDSQSEHRGKRIKSTTSNENDMKVNNWMEKSTQNRKRSEQDYGEWKPKNKFIRRY